MSLIAGLTPDTLKVKLGGNSLNRLLYAGIFSESELQNIENEYEASFDLKLTNFADSEVNDNHSLSLNGSRMLFDSLATKRINISYFNSAALKLFSNEQSAVAEMDKDHPDFRIAIVEAPIELTYQNLRGHSTQSDLGLLKFIEQNPNFDLYIATTDGSSTGTTPLYYMGKKYLSIGSSEDKQLELQLDWDENLKLSINWLNLPVNQGHFTQLETKLNKPTGIFIKTNRINADNLRACFQVLAKEALAEPALASKAAVFLDPFVTTQFIKDEPLLTRHLLQILSKQTSLVMLKIPQNEAKFWQRSFNFKTKYNYWFKTSNDNASDILVSMNNYAFNQKIGPLFLKEREISLVQNYYPSNLLFNYIANNSKIVKNLCSAIFTSQKLTSKKKVKK